MWMKVQTHWPDHHACPGGAGNLWELGEGDAEMPVYMPAFFKVIRHVRPKLSCEACGRIVQAPGGIVVPSKPTSGAARLQSARQSGRRGQKPLLARMHTWLEAALAKVSRKSNTAAAIRYALSRWPALTRVMPLVTSCDRTAT